MSVLTHQPATGRRRFRRLRALTALAVVPVLMLALTSTAQAATPAQTEPDIALLTQVRASSHPGFDRIVWEFEGPLPHYRHVEWVPQLIQGGSGHVLPVAGNAILNLVTYNANAHTTDTDEWEITVPRRQSFGLTNITEAVLSDDFEAVVGYGVGVNVKAPYTMFTLNNPSRIVVDIRSDYRTTNGSVHFLNEPNYVKGKQPYVQAKARKLVATAPAGAAMNHLFSGPTASEYAAGMRMVNSGATGWKNLSIRNGIARVTLTGGCNSAGATMTVANLIAPTLKQFSTVNYVKIYSPSGQTARPNGNSDSIPSCLEP